MTAAGRQLLGLVALAVLLALGALRAFAQAQGQGTPPATPQVSALDGWPVLAASLVTTLGAVAHAWITSGAAEQKRRADRADEEVKEMVQQLEELAVERRAIEMERDRLLKFAYSRGYISSDEIPVRKDRK